MDGIARTTLTHQADIFGRSMLLVVRIQATPTMDTVGPTDDRASYSVQPSDTLQAVGEGPVRWGTVVLNVIQHLRTAYVSSVSPRSHLYWQVDRLLQTRSMAVASRPDSGGLIP